ncbi:bestrophin-2a-like [Watersipora subatra]|uniref:bestrophin-2a-like n=1 Tax=Watersipora subatra TaxID=2589382 RepID=UPI00355BC56D
MTVTYTAKIATVKFKTLWKLLKRWRGSVYKHLWKDALLFMLLYFSLSLIYRFALNPTQKETFEKLVLYCKKESASIPVAFVLGFYVTVVVNRWWTQVNDAMPWPDDLAIAITSLVHGNDDLGRLMRRTLMRYVNLSWMLALCSISSIAKKRFPTLDHLVEIGMMTKNEQEIFESIKTTSNKYFIPIIWATTLITRARKEDRIRADYNKVYLIQLVGEFRGKLGTLFNYDWLSVPLVYTQVVTIAVHAYFLSIIVGDQFLESNAAYPDRAIDIYVPVFTLLQFLFYMGWLKVAESLINPFGEDDDDFDTNWVIDRNIQVSYLIVDDMHKEYPELIKDAYWDSIEITLPYTAAAEQSKMNPYMGSTNEIQQVSLSSLSINLTIDSTKSEEMTLQGEKEPTIFTHSSEGSLMTADAFASYQRHTALQKEVANTNKYGMPNSQNINEIQSEDVRTSQPAVAILKEDTIKSRKTRESYTNQTRMTKAKLDNNQSNNADAFNFKYKTKENVSLASNEKQERERVLKELYTWYHDYNIKHSKRETSNVTTKRQVDTERQKQRSEGDGEAKETTHQIGHIMTPTARIARIELELREVEEIWAEINRHEKGSK